LSEELKKQNNELKNKYKIRGFPTVYLLKADGSVILKTGYQRGGVQNYIKHLENAIAKAK
jgi:protein disulfide-isomerase